MKQKSWEMFKALGVETRLRIFETLKAEGPLGVKRLAEIVGISPAAVSQHLKILKQAGLVTNERKGYYIPYSVDESAMEECRSVMIHVCSCHRPNHRHGHPGPCGDDLDELESLKKYEGRIERELRSVRRRIEALKKSRK